MAEDRRSSAAPAAVEDVVVKSECGGYETVAGIGAPKRQRRPNVRLNEIGDRPLATVLELFLKRKKRRAVLGKPTAVRARSVLSLKRERAFGLADGDRMKSGAIRAPRSHVFSHLEKTSRTCKTAFLSSVRSQVKAEKKLPSGGVGFMSSRFVSKRNKMGMRRHRINGASFNSKRPGNARMIIYQESSFREPVDQRFVGASTFCSTGLRGSEGCSLDGVHSALDLTNSALDCPQQHKETNPNNRFQNNFLEESRQDTGSGGGREYPIDESLATLSQVAANSTIAKGTDMAKGMPKFVKPEELPVHAVLLETEVARLSGDVKDWLHGLGLGKYACIFQYHEVDSEALPLLTMDDLREMGITAVGARRKMFCEIQNLRQGQSLESDVVGD